MRVYIFSEVKLCGLGELRWVDCVFDRRVVDVEMTNGLRVNETVEIDMSQSME